MYKFNPHIGLKIKTYVSVVNIAFYHVNFINFDENIKGVFKFVATINNIII